MKNDKSNKLNPALFIFLIDQSASMSTGGYNSDSDVKAPIKIVSKALELFLRSLPKGSYYQLIGFGSNFIKYDGVPKKYSKENIEDSLKIVRSLDADLGGTDIYSPLQSIYENEREYDKIKLPKNIFLLTDGEIDNKKETLEIIEKYSSKFSIFSIGIGDSFDKDLIKNAGIIGKGGFNFCPNLDNLNTIIVNEINKAISPYISNFHMLCSLNKYCKIKLCDIPETIRSNQIINVGYITDNKYNKINVEVEYFEDKIIRNNYIITPIELENGEELSQLIISKYLYKEDDNKENEGLALKYQILSNYTTLFAEIELSNKMSDEMKSKIIGNEKNINNIENKIYEENIFCYRNKVNPSPISRKSAFRCVYDDDDVGLKMQFLEFDGFEPENLRLKEENAIAFNCDEVYKANNSFS